MEATPEAFEVGAALFDVFDQAVLVVDRHGRCTYANAAARQLFGDEPLVGRAVDDIAALGAPVGAALAGLVDRGETRVALPSGAGGVVTLARSGGSVFVVAKRGDGSEGRGELEDLRDNEARLRLATATASIGVHDFDIRGGTTLWSPELRAILGVAGDGPRTFEHVSQTLHDGDRERVLASMRASLDPAGPGSLRRSFASGGWITARRAGCTTDAGRCSRWRTACACRFGRRASSST